MIFNQVYKEHKILIDNLAKQSYPLYSPDKVIEQILEVDMQSSQNDIIFDSEELKIFSTNKEKRFTGIGEYVGENAVIKALHLAISNTELGPSVLKEAREVVVHFSIYPDITMFEIAEEMEILHVSVHADVKVFWTTTHDELLEQHYAKVMIVLTLNRQEEESL
ncbi:MAG: hypothetical protein QM497_00410 [Sulfurimonas sp.]